MIFSDFSERRAVYNNIRITVPINIETKLYIKGEFIGGCDIVKELFEKGELKTLLEKKNLI